MAAHPAATDVEHLHRGLEVVVGERDDVGVGAVTEYHGLLLQRPPQRRQVIAQPGGPLEIQHLGGRGHPVLEFAREAVGLTGEEITEILDDLAVFVGADPAHAGRRALVDVAEQAGAADLTVPLEHSGRAGAGGEHPGEQVQGLPDRPGVRVRTEVAHPLAARAAVDEQPGYSSLSVTASTGYDLSSR